MSIVGADGDAPMPTEAEENASLVRRFLTDVVADGDRGGLEAFVSENVTFRDLTVGDGVGVAGMSSLGRGMLAGADVDVEVVQTVAEDDLVAVRTRVSGTIGGLPVEFGSSGGSFEIPYVAFYRIADGRIIEVWSLHDGLGLVKQLNGLSKSVESPSSETNRSGPNERRNRTR